MDTVRRSSRFKTTKAALAYTPCKTAPRGSSSRNSTVAKHASSIHKVNYTLDKSKAIKKQRDATERSAHVDIKFRDGNIVLTFSSAAYQEFKTVTMNYLNSKNMSIQTLATSDTQNAIISESVSICDRGIKLFVLNFYNSTCKLLLDGNPSHITQFINNFLSNILSILDHNPLFDEINKIIRECCETYLARNSKSDSDVRPTQNRDSIKRPITGPTKTSTNEITHRKSSQRPIASSHQRATTALCSDNFPLCPICNRACDNQPTSVACDLCNS